MLWCHAGESGSRPAPGIQPRKGGGEEVGVKEGEGGVAKGGDRRVRFFD